MSEHQSSPGIGHPLNEELLYLADQQAHARARYNEDDPGLIRESKVIEWALRWAGGAAQGVLDRSNVARIICCGSTGCQFVGDSEDGSKCYCDTSDFHGSGVERKTGAILALSAVTPSPGPGEDWSERLAERVMQLQAAGAETLTCTQVLGLIAFVRDGEGSAVPSTSRASPSKPYDTAFHENQIDQYEESVVTSTNRDGFGNKLCPKCSLPHSEFADCPAMAPAQSNTAAGDAT